MREHKPIRWLFFLLLLSVAFPSTANFKSAMQLYEAGQLAEAKAAFEILSAIGDREALFNLGVMYYRGEAVEGDPAHGYALMFLATQDHNRDDLAGIVDKVWASFDEAQRARALEKLEALTPVHGIEQVHQRVFPVLLNDEDCEPTEVKSTKVAPHYPYSARRKGQMGTNYVQMTVSPQGYARDVYVYRTTSDDFNEASAKASLKFRFEPPADGLPVYGFRNQFTYMIESSPGKVSQLRTQKLEEVITAQKKEAEEGNVVAQFQYAASLNDLRNFEPSLKGLNGLDIQYRDANQWFESAARGGVPGAQYELGRNMMAGKGCEQDIEGGMKWIKAAAVGGHPSAQLLLANEIERQRRTDEDNLALMSWLRNAGGTGYCPARIELAWALSTISTPDLRDPAQALALLDEPCDRYFDEVRVLETRAAALARLGDFKKAVKLQKKALARAKSLDWDIPVMSDRLGRYQLEEPWQGPYF